ncbi:MAG: TraX protein [Aerococcus sp.]|nr:TraX protein [Aerococcus sp.]
MSKPHRQALLMLALSFIYAAVEFIRGAETISPVNTTISILVPIIAIAFALNIKDSKWRWPLIIGDLFILIIMGIFAFTHY